MWTVLTLVFCAVYTAQTIVIHQETGPVHIHRKANVPPLDGSPLEPDDVEATKTAKAFLKDLLPKLDTKIKKSVNSINLYELNAVFTLALYNFVLKGFRHAYLDNLVVRLSKSRVDFNANIPFLSTGGSVFANGTIDDNEFAIVANLRLSIKGRGPSHLNEAMNSNRYEPEPSRVYKIYDSFSDDIKITGILEIQKLQLPSEVYVLQITDAEIKIDINDIMIQFTLIKDLVPFKLTLMEFMNKPVDDIIKSVSRSAVRLVNEQLGKIPADTILDYLVQAKPPVTLPPVSPATVPPGERRTNLFGSYYPNYRYGVN